MSEKKEEGRIVAGAFSMAFDVSMGGASALSKAIERAMIEATEKCYAEGVTDPKEIIKAKLAAKDALVAKVNAAIEAMQQKEIAERAAAMEAAAAKTEE